jgi:hypothetical protein
MKATNIKWDMVDDCLEYNIDECDVPTEVEIPEGVSEDDIADYLSDEYGFLVESFDIVGKPKRKYVDLPQEEIDKQFYCNGLSVCRGDYENMPCPMYTAEITDEQMQWLIDTIYDVLVSQYYFDEEDVKKYIKGEIEDYRLCEDIDEAFWAEMEDIAVADLKMPYYEDYEWIQ